LNEGFLGTAAPLAADLVLLLEIGMGLGLLMGAWLARTRRFREHAWCQSVTVLLNLAVTPWRRRMRRSEVTEIAGLYILLSAGTRLLPENMRITRYKVWMRSVLALWWFVLLLGMATYTRWYVPHLLGK
jgi:hypothetical protein